MTLTRSEMLELKAQDGLLTDAERTELVGLGGDPGLVFDGALVRAALLEGLTDPPTLADGVLRVADIADDWPGVRAALQELRPTEARTPAIADSVMAALQVDEAELEETGRLLKEAVLLEAGSPPSLWEGVLEGIDRDTEWDATRAVLQEAVRAEAGSFHIADAVMAELQADRALDIDDNVISLDRVRVAPVRSNPTTARAAARVDNQSWSERYALPVAAMAAAAALMFVLSVPTQNPNADLAFDLSPVNHIEIEDISTDSNAMVQVLTFDEGAPTIIFIEEALEEEEGATL